MSTPLSNIFVFICIPCVCVCVVCWWCFSSLKSIPYYFFFRIICWRCSKSVSKSKQLKIGTAVWSLVDHTTLRPDLCSRFWIFVVFFFHTIQRILCKYTIFHCKRKILQQSLNLVAEESHSRFMPNGLLFVGLSLLIDFQSSCISFECMCVCVCKRAPRQLWNKIRIQKQIIYKVESGWNDCIRPKCTYWFLRNIVWRWTQVHRLPMFMTAF